MKIQAIKVYTHSNNGNLSKLLEKAKQPLATQDKFEMTNRKQSTSKMSCSCTGCTTFGCGSCGGAVIDNH